MSGTSEESMFGFDLFENKQKPKCKTCGGRGEVYSAGTYKGYYTDNDGIVRKAKNKPCPSCQDKLPTDEEIHNSYHDDHTEFKGNGPSFRSFTGGYKLGYKSAYLHQQSRIDELEQTIERNKCCDNCENERDIGDSCLVRSKGYGQKNCNWKEKPDEHGN